MKAKRNIGAVILAAGRGKRMKEEEVNKVALTLSGKPLISFTVDLLQKMKIRPVLVVIGHAKESVKNALKDKEVVFVDQEKQFGTGHALNCAISKVPRDITDVIVLYGDDSYLYKEETLREIINIHILEEAMITFLTITVENPSGLGRIIRDNGEVSGIIEEKDATNEQRKIKEINPNCYLFKVKFLKKYLPKITQSPVSGEYYLTSLIKIAKENNEKIRVVDGGPIPWKGINTKDDLEDAKNIFKSKIENL